MPPHDPPESPVRKYEIFREQALQAWRGQEAEARVLLDLSPRWMLWALAGILIVAAVGVLLAATTSIPRRATSTASARLSSNGDSLFVDAIFALHDDASIRAGQTMSFRPQDSGSSPFDLVILNVVPYPTATNTDAPGASNVSSVRRVLVHGAVPANRIQGDLRSIAGPATGGTVHVAIGEETLLHLFRPRTPVAARS
ncbi:MAG TPA: hypothetical protein VFP58_10720 [Candidatus Eisenbacteria bacterium]|nr:hypothetical protein [Candidatus Eisenbacteria bacterium]